MTDELSAMNLLHMWFLAARGGEAWLKDMRPKAEPHHRRSLLRRGLLAEEKVKERVDGRMKNLVRLTLTDRGWRLLSENMSAHVNARSYAAGDVLQAILTALGRYMRENDVSLAELLPIPKESPPEKSDAAAPAPSGDGDLWPRLQHAWPDLQQADEGIPLEKLRQAFADIPRDSLDNALLAWQTAGKIVLYPYDDGEKITPAVAASALRVAGRGMHVVYLK